MLKITNDFINPVPVAAHSHENAGQLACASFDYIRGDAGEHRAAAVVEAHETAAAIALRENKSQLKHNCLGSPKITNSTKREYNREKLITQTILL